MDGHRTVEAMNDAALDREIESLLDVEPSPEFVARVRTRVAAEPAPGGWRAPWMLAIAGGAAAIIAAVMVWPSADVNPSRTAPTQRPPVAEVVQTIPPVASAPAPQVRTTRPIAAAVAPTERTIEIDLPEVVIAENEMRTFASLVASVRQRRFDAAIPVAPNPDTPLEIRELPPVEPLEIEPIVRVAALQAEGERP